MLANFTSFSASTKSHMPSTAITTISDQIINVISSRLRDMVQEIIMNVIVKTSHACFSKDILDLVNYVVNVSKIIISLSKLQQLDIYNKYFYVI